MSLIQGTIIAVLNYIDQILKDNEDNFMTHFLLFT